MKTPQSSRRQSGNVMIYILLALVLIGALTVALTRQSDQGGDNLSYEQAELQASQLIAYSLAAQNIVNQMIMSGSDVDDINPILPSDGAFNTAPNIHKIYHPQGGGLNFKQASIPPFVASGVSTKEGWYINKNTNVEWTPTSAKDIILTAFAVERTVCERINFKITGSTIIPTLPNTVSYLVSGTSTELTIANCPECNGKTSLCVTGSAGNPSFYTILEAR